jgi:hypothetical protein
MTSPVLLIGTPIATDVRDPSANNTPEAPDLKTLSDLLRRLGENPPPAFAMLRTTCSLLAVYLNGGPEQVLLDSVNETRDGFRPFLESRKYTGNSVRSYLNFRRILLKSARALGWSPNDAVPEEWRGVLALATEMKCTDIVKDIARIRTTPGDVTIPDVDRWVEMKIEQDRSFSWANGKKRSFWRLLRDCGCTVQTPKCILRESKYGVPLDQFPPDLKAEVLALLKWKQAAYSLNRPKHGRHRAVTAKNLLKIIRQLFGFAVNIRGGADITSLSQLMQKQIVGEYVEWCINEREVKGRSLQCDLGLLGGSLRKHPSYTSLDIDWFTPLLESLPTEGETELKKRKAERYLEYSVVESIPAAIHSGRTAAEKKGIVQVARLTTEELLMKWIITLPWRQRNIREMRIGGPSPNVFKGRVPPFSDMDKPAWVMQEEEKNPAAEFWQFHFNADETKTGHEVSALLPRQLIGILEEYLKDFRPHLLRSVDPKTLLVGPKGKAMCAGQVTAIVGKLTLRHGRRRVTPHLFRNIVSFTWLKAHPKDYLTLSKMLWHSNINTTIKCYGSRFNESNGVSAMESWLDERAASSK